MLGLRFAFGSNGNDEDDATSDFSDSGDIHIQNPEKRIPECHTQGTRTGIGENAVVRSCVGTRWDKMNSLPNGVWMG